MCAFWQNIDMTYVGEAWEQGGYDRWEQHTRTVVVLASTMLALCGVWVMLAEILHSCQCVHLWCISSVAIEYGQG